MKERRYHYFYKITNNINNHFYYGVHNTDNLNDGYMGSGKRLHYAYKKYGIENFSKEVLKFFDTTKDAFDYEAEIVNEELIRDERCYNIQQGGDSFNTTGLTAVKDAEGNKFLTFVDDPKYISGEYLHVLTGYFMAKDAENNFYYITKEDPRWISGELVGASKGIKRSKEYKEHLKNSLVGKDRRHKTRWVCNEKEIIKINISDTSTYLDLGYQTGKCYYKIKQPSISEAHKRLHFQKGEKNSQYGTCWITKDKQNKKIKKEELEQYISLGWSKGRFVK